MSAVNQPGGDTLDPTEAGGSATIPPAFGQYRLDRLIGKGGMAQVFEGEHTGLRKRVAVKVLDPHMARNDVLRERFLREGERAARVRHPNIVDITDVGEVAGLPFLVMEYLEGETLADLLDREGALPIDQATNVMLPVIAAVAAGHELGVVHRDLKPENVFLHRDGALRMRPKVLDFGVSRALGGDQSRDRLTVPNSVLGTPYYMAPEQARGEECDERADQYALGAMMFEMVTGFRLREADTLPELLRLAARGIAPPASAYMANVPPDLEEAMARALAPTREGRFVSVVDFAFALFPFATARARDYWTAELSGSIDDERSFDHLPTFDDDISPLRMGAPFQPPPVGAGRQPTVDLLADEVAGDTFAELGAMPAPAMPTGIRKMPRIPKVAREPGSLKTPLAATMSAEDEASTALPLSPGRRFAPFVLTAVVSAALAVVAIEVVREPTTSAPPPPVATTPAPPPTIPSEDTVDVAIEVEPRQARVYLDGALLSQGPFHGKVQRDGRSYVLKVEAPGYVAATRTVEADDDVRLSVALVPDATPPEVDEKAAPRPTVIRRVPAPAAPPVIDEPPEPDPAPRPSPAQPNIERANPYQ